MFYQIYVKYTYVIKIFIYDIWTIIFIFPMAGYRNKYCMFLIHIIPFFYIL